MTGDNGKQYLKDYITQTEKMFEDYLIAKTEEAAQVSKIPAELIKRFTETAKRGKRIRGALTVLGYNAVGGGNHTAILNASLFIELFHAAVLVHDDIMDEDNTRRGLVSLHKQFEQIGDALNVNTSPLHYGESMATAVGDAGFYFSWEHLLNSDFPAEHILAAGKLYAEYIIRVVHGQILDVTNTTLQQLTEKDILNVLKYKTAEYTAVLPLLVGATLAGETDAKKFDAIKRFGLAFGWAFQIQDDVLGIFGTQEEMGKPIGSDIREGKNTLLMLHLSQHGTSEQKAFQRTVLGNRDVSHDDVERMKQILKDAGSYQYVIDLGWKYVEEGKKEINAITDDRDIQEIFESLLVYMMERTN